MASHHTHPYNPAGVIAFFISFRCYGTWLHGDERGSMDRSQYHAFGTAPIASDPSRFAFERSLLRHPPMTLDAAMRRTVEKTIQEVCRHRGWHLHAVNAQKDHVHTVVTARDVTPERVLNDFKIWCTRRLREMPSLTLGLPHKRDTHETDGGDTRETDGGDTRETDGGDTGKHGRRSECRSGCRTWSRHGSTVWLWTEAQMENAMLYTLTGQGEPPSAYRESDL